MKNPEIFQIHTLEDDFAESAIHQSVDVQAILNKYPLISEVENLIHTLIAIRGRYPKNIYLDDVEAQLLMAEVDQQLRERHINRILQNTAKPILNHIIEEWIQQE